MLVPPKHPLSALQALGLAGANANAVNANTSAEIASYILSDKGKVRKHLLNDSYNALVERVALIIEWERRYKLTFGLTVDCEHLLVPLQPRNHDLIVDADQLHMRTLIHTCRDLFRCQFTGTAWREEERGYNIYHENILMGHFVQRLYSSWQDLGGPGPKGKWVTTDLVLPQSENDKPAKPFNKRDLELSRCISLREYLLSLIFSWKRVAEEGKARQWVSPHKGYKVWCLGTYGHSLTGGSVFHPVVSWKDGYMYIEFSYGKHHNAKTGTFYVCRTNP